MTEPADTQEPPRPQHRLRGILLNIARVVFLLATIAFAAWSLHGQWGDIARDLAATNIGNLLLSLLVLYIGLLAFGLMWIRVMRGFGYVVPLTKGLGIFYVGQLGRYIPGSVWSFGAQATMARSVKVPPRTTVTAGLIGLGFSLATAGVVGMIAVALGLLPVAIPSWLAILIAIVVLAVLAPPIINFLGSRIAARADRLKLSLLDVAIIIGLLVFTWIMDGLALFILSDGFAVSPSHWGARGITMVGAWGLSYVVGVVIIFAPAGLGAREAALTFLLAPLLGVPGAAALAIVSRIPITIVDFSLALVFWLVSRRSTPTSVSGDTSGPALHP